MNARQILMRPGTIAPVSGSIVDDEASPPIPPDEAGTTDQTKPWWRKSPLTLLGIGLLVAGLACLGWVGFQYFGTNVISERAFETEAEQLRAKWSEEDRSDPDGKKQASVIPGEAIALLRIPAFGADYEIPILNGTDLSILSRGVGHYSSTAAPGQIGNFAVAGHRVTHGQPFARLLDLKRGDEVIVETRDAIYTYVLDDSPRQLTVKDSDTWVIDPVPGQPDAKPTQALITLTTCQDLFRSSDRSIGFGHLVSTQNK
jgi:sortase A